MHTIVPGLAIDTIETKNDFHKNHNIDMKNDKRLNIDGLCYYERREEKIQSSDEKERKRNELVGNEDLFQFILLFGEFQSSLDAVTIRCFPHVIIFDNSFQTLPRQLETKARISFSLLVFARSYVFPLDFSEIFSTFVDGFFERIGLGS